MLTPKQEAFCLAIAAGKKQADAYREAFDASRMKPATVYKRASELMERGDIKGRVQELRAPAAQEVQYDLAQAMREAQEAFEVARQKGNGGAMVAAATLRAKLNGLLVNRVEDVTDPLKKAIGNLPPERAEQMLQALDRVDAIKKKAKSAS